MSSNSFTIQLKHGVQVPGQYVDTSQRVFENIGKTLRISETHLIVFDQNCKDLDASTTFQQVPENETLCVRVLDDGDEFIVFFYGHFAADGSPTNIKYQVLRTSEQQPIAKTRAAIAKDEHVSIDRVILELEVGIVDTIELDDGLEDVHEIFKNEEIFRYRILEDTVPSPKTKLRIRIDDVFTDVVELHSDEPIYERVAKHINTPVENFYCIRKGNVKLQTEDTISSTSLVSNDEIKVIAHANGCFTVWNWNHEHFVSYMDGLDQLDNLRNMIATQIRHDPSSLELSTSQPGVEAVTQYLKNQQYVRDFVNTIIYVSLAETPPLVAQKADDTDIKLDIVTHTPVQLPKKTPQSRNVRPVTHTPVQVPKKTPRSRNARPVVSMGSAGVRSGPSPAHASTTIPWGLILAALMLSVGIYLMYSTFFLVT